MTRDHTRRALHHAPAPTDPVATPDGSLARHIAAAQRRLEAIARVAAGAPPEAALAAALEALGANLEELQVAEEELAVQQAELAAARDLAEAEGRRYRELFEAAPDASFVTDAAGVIREANRAAARLLRIEAAELAGAPLAGFVALAERPTFRTTLARLSGAGAAPDWLEWEARLEPRRGEPLAVAFRVAVVRDGPDQSAALHWLVRDVTARELAAAARERLLSRAEAAEVRFRGLLEAAPDAVVIVDAAGRIAVVNRQAELLFGYDRQELVGQPVEALIPERVGERHAGHRAGYLADPRTRPMGAGLELAGRRKDGREVPVEISLSPVRTEDGLLVMAAVRDITARRQAEGRRAVQVGVTRLLAEAVDGREVARPLLELIGAGLGWVLGEWWRVDATAAVLRLVDAWWAPGVDGSAFKAASREATFAPGVGLPGRAWAAGRAVWAVDVAAEPSFARAAPAGLAAAVAFPIHNGRDVTGALLFLADQARPPDAELEALLEDLGG